MLHWIRSTTKRPQTWSERAARNPISLPSRSIARQHSPHLLKRKCDGLGLVSSTSTVLRQSLFYALCAIARCTMLLLLQLDPLALGEQREDPLQLPLGHPRWAVVLEAACGWYIGTQG